MIRKLPIFFLIEASKSMKGAPILGVENCLNLFLNKIKKDPWAIESVYVSIISYKNNQATLLLPLTELIEIVLPKIECAGISNLNIAINFLLKQYLVDYKKPSIEERGDYKPMLFILTGIAPYEEINEENINFLNNSFSDGWQNSYAMSIEEKENKKIDIQNNKIKNVQILTFSNEYVQKWYGKYFENIVNIEQVDEIYFNQFFKLTS